MTLKSTTRRILQPFRLVGWTALAIGLFAVLWVVVAAMVLFPIACWAWMLIILGMVVENIITQPEGWSLIDNIVLLVGSWITLGGFSALLVEYMWFEDIDPLMPDIAVDVLLFGIVWKNVDTSMVPTISEINTERRPFSSEEPKPPDEDARTAYSINENKHYPIDEKQKE